MISTAPYHNYEKTVRVSGGKQFWRRESAGSEAKLQPTHDHSDFRHLCGVTVGVIILLAAGVTVANDAIGPPAKLHTETRLHDALAQRRAMFASGQTLRDAATELQTTTGVTVLLDRRVNPETAIEMSTGFVTVGETIQAMAECVPATAASLGDHYTFIGPTAAAGRLRTLTEINRQAIQQQRRSMDATEFRRLIALRPASWPDLAEPRQLILNAASESGLAISNADEIPHDLWAAAQLPELSFADFTTLVLNQFNLTFVVAGDGIVSITSVPETVAIEQRHRVPLRHKDVVVQRWKNAFPELQIQWKGTAAMATATIETHEELERLIRGEAPMTVQAAGIPDRLFTMTVPEGTQVESVIASLRGQGIPIRIEGRSGATLATLLKQTVMFEVEQAPAHQFFQQAFGKLGATIQIRQNEVILKFPDE